MAREPFKGTINVDIRDSVPGWSPFEPPKARLAVNRTWTWRAKPKPCWFANR